jgi:hypothetical protein
MPFFRQKGYQLALPEHEAFNNLPPTGQDLEREQKQRLFSIFQEQVFHPAHYQAGLKALSGASALMPEVCRRFRKMHQDWGFVLYPHYQVVLTLYGPGGYYLPRSGKIVILTTKEGRFIRRDPLHTVVHEMVHLGVHRMLESKYRLRHWEKERLVDLICQLKLGDLLPGYRMQPKGNKALDPFTNKETLADIPSALEQYLSRHPRP